jgi:hypothetical protein
MLKQTKKSFKFENLTLEWMQASIHTTDGQTDNKQLCECSNQPGVGIKSAIIVITCDLHNLKISHSNNKCPFKWNEMDPHGQVPYPLISSLPTNSLSLSLSHTHTHTHTHTHKHTHAHTHTNTHTHTHTHKQTLNPETTRAEEEAMCFWLKCSKSLKQGYASDPNFSFFDNVCLCLPI